jgi:N-acetylglucosamine-6-phosphate deacetylase
MRTAYTAPWIFTGEQWMEGVAIICNDDTIEVLTPVTEIPLDLSVADMEQGFIAPAFIDVQVYGAAGKLFSMFPEPSTLQLMQEAFAAQGTCLFQPTLATNTIAVFKKAIDAVRQYKAAGGRGVHGLHLEGPWLNPVRAGAHVQEWMHRPSPQEVKNLLEHGKGIITMITLAPEMCSPEVIRLIRSYGVVISAGHSDAGFEQAMAAFEEGINAVTHLYNAMSPLHHREPGLVGACFRHPSVRASIIPDGYHVHFEAIRIAKQVMGERLFAITDAVTETAEGPYRHEKSGNKYECNGTLSGSAISMFEAYRNLVEQVGLEKGEALRMCSLYPARVLGADQQYGKIESGYKSELVWINEGQKKANLVQLYPATT